MYGEFLEFVPLTEEEILKRVSQEDIIEMAIGYKPVMYQKILNPLKKKDRFPGAYFEWFNGKLWFIDFGDQPTHRVVMRFIRDYYNLTYVDALHLINTHFNLGLGDNSNFIVPKTIIYHTPETPNIEKQRADILYHPRPYGNGVDARFWSKFNISKQNLLEDGVFAAVWYKVFSIKKQEWIVFRPSDPIYVFTEFKERVKIYRPWSNTPDGKWCTNCSSDDIGNYNNISDMGTTLFIKKSYKDCRIMRNLGFTDSIWLQNEGCIPSEKIIIDLVRRFNRIIIFFDNDIVGQKQALKLASIFNEYFPDKTEAFWLPEKLNKDLNIKDPGEFVAKKGDKELKALLKKRGYLPNS